MSAPRPDRRRRWRRGLLLGAGLIVLLLAGIGANTVRNRAGLTPVHDSIAERVAELAPFWRMVPPQAALSQARAVLMSGCDGPRDNMDFWAGLLAETGRPGLIIDSHSPRHLDGWELWRLVCAGQVLPGAERAGDLVAGLSLTGRAPVVLLGASHGGWTVLEFLAQAVTGTTPPGIEGGPARPDNLLPQVQAVVLLYPYCGLLNGADQGDWQNAPPILMVGAAEDEIVSTPACAALAERLRQRGARIDWHVLPGAGHGFDQRERAAFSTLTFDPAQRAHAADLVRAFLAAN
ncbi:dienelactone hydrolase family protein [Paracoccus jeotgali]|uniref:Dienelactone hydrolase n=1 Tax=Paracoccus jeotgali TaxID=2065379 RepID=A0A2K9MIW5_9RHOB|nr:dienelactone hydrolase family protein [Paracoccus jeotgali]AUM75422.1 dienelactone hydrolase [Paracoccus jeotgali]